MSRNPRKELLVGEVYRLADLGSAAGHVPSSVEPPAVALTRLRVEPSRRSREVSR